MTTATAHAAEPTHQIVPEDYFSLAWVYQVALSPDGQSTVWSDLRWDPDTRERNADLWHVDNVTGATRRLTFDPGFDSTPTWGPGGKWIYFKSARAGAKNQVFRIDPSGLNIKQVTRVDKGIKAYQLSDDGTAIYYTVSHKTTDDPWKGLKNKYGSLIYGHGVVTKTSLHRLDMGTWRSERLVKPDRVINEFSVAPNSKKIAMLTTPTDELITNEGWSRVDIWDAGTGKVTSLVDKQWRADAPSPYGWLDGPKWSGNSRALSFTVSFDGYPSEIFVADMSKATPTMRKIVRDSEVTVSGGQTAWRGLTGDLLYRAEDHGRERIYMVENAASEPGASYAVTGGDVVVGAWEVSRTGRDLVLGIASPVSFGDVWIQPIEKDGVARKQLSNINPHVSDWKLPTLSVVKWTSRDGGPVEGILAVPYGKTPGAEKLPLVVYIHGGPTAAAKFRLRFWGYGRTLMAAQGYAVLSPNYRGSTGYGDKFMVDLIGHENDVDTDDILRGVDEMVKTGVADKDRMAVMGWSNGGYLTNAIITKDHRFKAAISGAGVFDMAMQWATEDTPGHVINYMKGLPWDAPQHYIDGSPLYSANKIKTPTLIHVGENDPRVPAIHAKALHRALHYYVKVDTELVIYPGEGHGLSKAKHREAKMDWDIQWLEKYLKPAAPEKK